MSDISGDVPPSPKSSSSESESSSLWLTLPFFSNKTNLCCVEAFFSILAEASQVSRSLTDWLSRTGHQIFRKLRLCVIHLVRKSVTANSLKARFAMRVLANCMKPVRIIIFENQFSV